ncbi:MAG: chemotaxis protein [Leptolyngbya sp.]|nr:MAG: chemotaxis protein [Leptolyngbya sp.]
MLNNFKLRGQIFLGFSLPVTLLLGLSGLIFAVGNQTSQTFKEVGRAQEVIIGTDEMILRTSMMGRHVRGYLLVQNNNPLKEFEEQKRLYEKAVETTKPFIDDPEQKKVFDRMLKLGNQFDDLCKKTFRLIEQGKLKDAITLYLQDSKTVVGEIDQLNTEFNQHQQEILAHLTQTTTNSMHYLVFGSLIVGLLGLILSGAVASLIWARVTKTVNRSVDAIASSASEIAAAVEQQERTATQQATAVSQTTATMNELGVSSRQSVEQADIATTSAQQVSTLASSGTKAVTHTLEDMAFLKQKVEQIAERIQRLSGQAEQIGSISSLVGDLANQTNMLALNAAVEAVRAGEQGKGFTVVSGEIRKLADQSKRSAEKIRVLVSEIQTAINATAAVTDEGTKQVEQGVKTAQGTAETFAGVADAINSVVLNSQQISLTAKQQAIAVQQVVTVMDSLKVGADQAASGISQTRVETQQLNEVALNLKAVV